MARIKSTPRPTGTGGAPPPRGLCARAPHRLYDAATDDWYPVYGPENCIVRECVFHPGTLRRFVCPECQREDAERREYWRRFSERIRQEVGQVLAAVGEE